MSYYARFVAGEADATILIDLDGHPDEDMAGSADVTLTLGLRRKPWEDDLEINAEGDVVSVVLWTVQFTLPAADLDYPGNFEGYVWVTQGAEVLKFPVEVDVLPDRGNVSALLS